MIDPNEVRSKTRVDAYGTKVFENDFTRIEFNSHGVTIWDVKAGKWVLDASDIFVDKTFRVVGELEILENTPTICAVSAFYTEKKNALSKRSRKKKNLRVRKAGSPRKRNSGKMAKRNASRKAS